MAVTLNKDGTPRKVGSGKTKGAGCFEKTTWSVLKDFVGEEVEIPISRVWLRSVGVSDKLSPKSKAMKKKPVVQKPQPKNLTKEKGLPELPSPKPYPKSIPPKNMNQGEEYDPPPLFASDHGIRNY
tara:strand:- start:872 stop:1249 length:378 start_codon:yes stop_codon:yes gene_type:complete